MEDLYTRINERMVIQKDGVVQFVVTEENAAQWKKLVLQAKKDACNAYTEEYPELSVDENSTLCNAWLKGFVIGLIGVCAAAYLKTPNKKWKEQIRTLVDKFWN